MSDERELPVSFSSFIVSMAASAMLHLGETADPDSGAKQVNLPLARQTVGVLDILQTKTEGNLDEEEKQLLDTLLADLKGKLDEASG